MQRDPGTENGGPCWCPQPAGTAAGQHCALCGKDAVGVQSFGCRSAVVCRDHAYSLLRALRPGEKYSTGDCCFERFALDG